MTEITEGIGAAANGSALPLSATPLTSRRSHSGPIRPKFDRAVATGDALDQVQFAPVSSSGRLRARIDRALLDRAAEVLDDIEHADADQNVLAVQSLRSIACDLWPTVGKATIYHHSVLSLIEALVDSVDGLSSGQASALRSAFHDLGAPVLSESHVEILRSQFIDEGHNPLTIFSEVESEDADGTA